MSCIHMEWIGWIAVWRKGLRDADCECPKELLYVIMPEIVKNNCWRPKHLQAEEHNYRAVSVGLFKDCSQILEVRKYLKLL